MTQTLPGRSAMPRPTMDTTPHRAYHLTRCRMSHAGASHSSGAGIHRNSPTVHAFRHPEERPIQAPWLRHRSRVLGRDPKRCSSSPTILTGLRSAVWPSSGPPFPACAKRPKQRSGIAREPGNSFGHRAQQPILETLTQLSRRPGARCSTRKRVRTTMILRSYLNRSSCHWHSRPPLLRTKSLHRPCQSIPHRLLARIIAHRKAARHLQQAPWKARTPSRSTPAMAVTTPPLMVHQSPAKTAHLRDLPHLSPRLLLPMTKNISITHSTTTTSPCVDVRSSLEPCPLICGGTRLALSPHGAGCARHDGGAMHGDPGRAGHPL